MIDLAPYLTIKSLGLVAGVLLFGYAFAIAKLARFAEVSDLYASAFSTVALVIILVATGGFLAGWLSLLIEGSGYAAVIVGATLAFRRIAHKPQRYEKA